MKKNYPKVSFCLKSGLFLVVFLFFSTSNFAQNNLNISNSYTINGTEGYDNVTLTSNNSILTVNGTLVVDGDLIMDGNSSQFIMGANAKVIVFGDFEASNKVELSISSYLIIHGDFEKGGSSNQGDLNVESGNIYIYGEVSNWGDEFETCEDYNGNTNDITIENCDYGTEDDFSENTSIPEDILELSNCNDLKVEDRIVNLASNATFIATTNNRQDVSSYQWQTKNEDGNWMNITGENEFELEIINTILQDSGKQYRVVVRSNDVNCKISVSNAATLTVEEPIEITQQPENITTCQGNIVNFTVEAQGQGLTYQWQRNDDGNSQNFFNVENISNFQDTQTSTLRVNASETWLNNKRFRVIITDENGNTVTSKSALLSVNQSPQGVYTQPPNTVVCEGNDISFQTDTSNDQRQWQVSEDNGLTWRDISNNTFYQNVNSQRLDIKNTPANFDKNLYRIEVSNQICSVYSNPASLQVDSDPITQQPQDVTAGFGNNAFIEAEVSGNNLTYQWQTYSSNWYYIYNNGNYNGTNTKRLELITVGYDPIDGSRYRLLVTNQNGCVSVSDTAYLNVGENECTELPTISLNAPSTTCAGQINISGTFTGTIPWDIEGLINGQAFNISINERNFDSVIDIQQSTTIEILKITDANGCENNAPDASVTINVINQIENNIISGTKQSCGEFDPGIITGKKLGAGYNYLWEMSTTSEATGFSAASGVYNEVNYNPGVVLETTWYRRKVRVQNCAEDISNVVEISINSPVLNNNISFFNGHSGILQATANENQEITLTAPEGTVFTYVDFASYGTPNNNNGTFSINEACHASNSQLITESYLLGEIIASIPATNAVFADPCVNTFKRLYVSAFYAEAFCKGANPGTISGTTINGNNIEYQWLISPDGTTGSFSTAPGNNTSQNYEPGTLNQDIWLKRQVISGSCIDESPVLYIPVKGVNTWTGTQDTNWNNTNNWGCNTLPTLETNVLIPENLASGNYPEINPGTNAFAKDLIIENNAGVNVTGNWLRIAGDLSNSGVLNTETGSVSFQGSDVQLIPNSAFENNQIQNLRINNTSGVTSEAIIEITGTLIVEKGAFDTGNELTLISNEIQTALIDGSGNGEIIGLVTMQRYLDSAFGYKYFSSPFQNSEVGHFDPYMNFQDPTTGFPHFYRYNENRRIDSLNLDATGWEVYTDSGNSLEVVKGYALNFGTTATAETIALIGEVNNGPIPAQQLLNHHGEYTKGFHLAGNPYPSPIDWEAEQGWIRTNIDNSIYFFTASETNQYTGTYTAYINDISTGDPLVDGGSSNIIPSMQGFFIKVSDSDTDGMVTGNFGMNNKVRVTNFDQEFLRSQVVDLKSIIRLEAGFNVNRKDALVIYFSPYATQNFEKEMDAHKLMNTDPAVPNFYNITKSKKELAINAIPFPESRSYKKVSLGIKSEQSGEMKINLASVENLSPNFNIYLIDHDKGLGQNLRNKAEYIFNIKAGTHNSRFELMFSEKEITNPAIAFNKPFDVKVEDGNVVISLNLQENQKGVLRASTITGQILQIEEASGKDRVIFEGITSDGVYIINLQVGKTWYAKKVLIKK